MVKELGLIHFAPVEFEKHFKALVKLGDKNIEFLSKSVNKAGHFGIENKSDAKSLLSKLKIDLDQISDIVSVSIYLHDKVCDDEISLNHLLDELKDFSLKKGIKGFDRVAGSIRKLIKVKPSYLKYVKRGYYATASLDNLFSVDLTENLRAAYSNNEKTIIDLIPISILRLVLKNDKNEKKYITLQLTEDSLNILKESLSESKNKLKALKKKVSVK